jgi:glycosyltransferase involved in cell wall biosynthesis
MSDPAAAGAGRRLVLLLNNPFSSDSRSWKIARSLAAAGWSVTVVARPADGLPDREERDGFAVVRIDQPRPLAWLPTPRLPEAATGEPARQARSWLTSLRAGATAIVGRPVQAIRYLRLAGQWADRIVRVVPGADIWQAEGLITLPVALALRRHAGGQVVYDARDLQVESSRFARLPGPWRRLLARRERDWARSADAIVTVNRPYAEVIERRLGARPTIVFNGPAANGDARPFPIRERLGIGPTTRIVLCLGNVAPGRGVEQLCRALTDVPDAVLLVVGPGGDFRERLRAEAAALPAADRIHFLPEVAPADIPAWTVAADVAAMPIQPTTLNHRLTTPTRLFDALGAGVPIVVSDLPGMAEIVRETGAGVICDRTDPAAIARALREVLDASPERRAELRAAALAAAAGTYAWEHQVGHLLEVYERLRSTSAGRPVRPGRPAAGPGSASG